MPAAEVAGLPQTALWRGQQGFGSFTLSPNGAWVYTPDAQAPEGAWVAGKAYTDRLSWTTPAGYVRTIEVDLLGVTLGSTVGATVLGHSSTLTPDTTPPVMPHAALVADTGNGLPGTEADGVTASGALVLPSMVEMGARLSYRVTRGQSVGLWSSAYAEPARDGSADGDYTVEVRQTDLAGQSSAPLVIQFKLDTAKPAMPDAKLTLDSSNGVLGKDADLVTHNPGITAPTNIETGAKVAYRITKGAGAPSDWSTTYTPPATDGSADGDYLVEVRQTDAAGNVSDVQTLVFTLDTRGPLLAPTLGLDFGSDSGAKGDGITKVATPTLTGTADANAWVRVYRGGSTLLGTVQADDNGVWTYSAVALGDGLRAFTARQVDAAGNESAASNVLNLMIDSVAAPPVVVPYQIRYIRVYHSDAQSPLALSELRVMSGNTNLAAGKTATLSADSGYAAHGANNTAALTDGVAAGWWSGSNGSGSNITVVNGSTKPFIELDLGALQNVDAIVLSSVADDFTKATNIRVYASASSMAGQTYSQLASDMLVKRFDVANLKGLTSTWSDLGVAAQPLLSGTGEVGATVDIFDTAAISTSNASGQIGSAVVQSDGAWRWQASSIVSGSHTITTQQTDRAGNKSALSSGVTFKVDSTAMPVPVLDAGSDSGVLADGRTRVTLPKLTGMALSAGDGNNMVQVFDNGTLLGSATIQHDKSWSFTPISSLGSGTHSITVKDLAAGKTSAALSLNIDTVCTTPVIDAVADTRTAPVVTGSGEPGATITLTATPADGAATQTFTTTVRTDGSWSVDTGGVLGGQVLLPGKAYTLFVTATDAAGNTAAATAVRRVLYDNAMDARLQSADWRVDQASRGQIDAGDVLRLSFDQAVALTAGSLPTAVFGTGAVLAAVEPEAGKSRFWDVRLGTGQTLGGAAVGVTGVAGTALAQAWALTGVSDAVGNVGTVNVGAGSLTALTAQVQAKQAPTWQVGMADVEDAGTLVQGWATPGASLRLNWGGQLSDALTADAQGYWSYSFYKNESMFGRKVPQLDTDQTLSLLQVNANNSTTTLWSQTARAESTPVQGPIVLAEGATARPLSVQLAVRAGRSVALDVRDATQDMPAGSWQLKVSGLAAYHTLNRGSRDSAGVWTVDASDWADLRIGTATDTVQEDRVLTLSYQQKQGSGPTATWVTQRQASVGLSVVPWLAPVPANGKPDPRNDSQVLQAWNLGLMGLNGAGITVDAEGTGIVVANNSFTKANVTPISFYSARTGSNHGTVMGQMIAGGWGSGFVGIAYGAFIAWDGVNGGFSPLADIDNNSWGIGYSGLGTVSVPQSSEELVSRRNGLGQIITFSAGNDSHQVNTSLANYKKNPGYIVVAALSQNNGEVMYFSQRGEGLMGAMPGDDNGTSAASAQAAGLVALLLQANPGLGFRDVQSILAYTSRYLQTSDPYSPFTLNAAKTLNGAGLHFSVRAGFGVFNAFDAGRLAADWLAGGYAPATVTGWWHDMASNPTVYTVSASKGVETRVSINITQDVRLESLQLEGVYTDPNASYLSIQLISPSGTVSPITSDYTPNLGSRTNANIQGLSWRFAGESSLGTWTVVYSHFSDTDAVATVKDIKLILFGTENQVDDRYVYTSEFQATYANLADAHTRAQMGWLTDLNGGNDSLMLSAMNTAVQVHLGRNGWLTSSSYKVLMAPGTRIENAFGGDGNDVLVGLANGKSILRGNEGNDVLLAYGAGSTLDGGNADDWLWLGGDTSAVGGQGNDRFVVFQGEGTLTSAAAVRARMSDFDATQDSLMVYDTAGNFKLAQFDSAGVLTGWAAVSNASVLQTLRSQLAQSDAPDVLGVAVSGSASAPTLTLTWDQSPVHAGSAVGSYAGWTLNGVAPVAATLTGGSLSLAYSGVGADAGQGSGVSAGVSVLDTSDSQLYSTLGVKLAYQKIYVGSAGADTVDASGQSAAVAVFGQGGSDVLTGGAGADLLVAAGLTAANVQVRMTGGQGADVFRLDMGIGNVGSGSVGGGSAGSGSASGRLQVSDFSLAQGDRLDLDALLQTIAHTNFVEDCVQISRTGNDAVLAFDLSGQKAFASSALTVVLDNVYTQTTDITLRTLTYGSGMGGVLG